MYLDAEYLEAGLRTTTAGPGNGYEYSAYIIPLTFEGQRRLTILLSFTQVETKHPRF
jgi:hypothetical protein